MPWRVPVTDALATACDRYLWQISERPLRQQNLLVTTGIQRIW